VLKDDKMMGMLTFVVIMIALGTIIQRVDVIERFFGDGPTAIVLQRDEVIVRANALTQIDVLANDDGVDQADAENLFISQQPACGRVFIRDGKARYLPAERCAGTQSFRYAISGRDYVDPGEVAVVVRINEPTQADIAAEAQRDVPAPSPTAPSPAVPNTAGQQLDDPAEPQVAQPAPGSETSGALVQAPAVPRPEAPTVTGLQDTTGAAGTVAGGGSAEAGVTLGGTGSAPSITAPTGGLIQVTEAGPLPVIRQPDPETPLAQGDPAHPAPQAPAPQVPGEAELSGSQPAATLALAQIEPAAPAPEVRRETGGADAEVPRIGPSEIGSGAAMQDGLGEPAEALAAIRGLGSSTELAPVDTSSPEALGDPGATSGAASTGLPDGTGGANTQVASLPQPTARCTVPPSLILDVKPAGLTEIVIESPCRAGRVAELSYDGLRFAVALDAAGSATLAAVGFQQASDATLRFDDEEPSSFNIPFADTERMERVALIWDMPVDLDLHAFEFGALPSSSGHVGPDQPRSFREVRRNGGGYLLEYEPVGEMGQSISVYTHWRRNGGRTGVVKLAVDYATRAGARQPDACGGGALAEPGFTVMRASGGKILRPSHRRLASLACTAVSIAADRFVGDAVDDMIIRQR
jgi:hypothetical protein